MTNPIRATAGRMPGHWMQGDLADGAGNMCAVGHLLTEMDMFKVPAVVANANPEFERALGLLNQAAMDKFPDRIDPTLPENRRPHDIVQVNDHHETDLEDLLQVFELAALRWDVEAGA